MEYLLPGVILILALLIIILAVRLFLMRKAAREISEGLCEHLAADTNTLIDISTRDPVMRRLASEINTQLRLLRKERLRYELGDRELKEAITGISHDLRTPLTAISGYLTLLECEDKSENAGHYISRIENRVEALNSLTEELFRYSVVTSEQELKPERLDIVKALEECLLSFYAAMQKRGICPEIQLPEEPVYRLLDANALNRVLSNIISNALKYSGGDFHVELEIDGSMCFSNSAPNMTALDAGRLFDRFYTVEASRNSTGLGLSIAKLLTERMGGTISSVYSGGRLSIHLSFKE